MWRIPAPIAAVNATANLLVRVGAGFGGQSF
jgi:hypothetical protein